MRPRSWIPLLLACLLWSASPGAGALLDHNCVTGARPGATLLIPWFEVELDHPAGRNTLFSLHNAAAEPTLARVVLWTDWGLPALGFNVYLAAADVQSVNLADVLIRGQLPVTGSGTGTIPGAAGCRDPLAVPTLDAPALAELQAKHRGAASPVDGLCYGSGREGPQVAVGYLTVDVVKDCSEDIRFPGDVGYFTGVAANDNVLWGDVFLVDPARNRAQGYAAVSILADAERFGPPAQVPTFYVDYHHAYPISDHRAPLGATYRAHFLNGGAFAGGTELIAFTHGFGDLVEPVPCGESPLPFPTLTVEMEFRFRDEAGAELGIHSLWSGERTVRVRVGSDELPATAPFGQVDFTTLLYDGLIDPPIESWRAQSWLIPLLNARGPFSAGLHATEIAGFCEPAGPEGMKKGEAGASP